MPVFRISGSLSGSFGIILLGTESFEGTKGNKDFFWTPSDIIKHEWGHSIQQMTFGLIPYLFNIGIPSVFIDNGDKKITADLIGGVNRNYNSEDVKQGWNYFGWGRLIGPFWWW